MNSPLYISLVHKRALLNVHTQIVYHTIFKGHSGEWQGIFGGILPNVYGET